MTRDRQIFASLNKKVKTQVERDNTTRYTYQALITKNLAVVIIAGKATLFQFIHVNYSVSMKLKYS